MAGLNLCHARISRIHERERRVSAGVEQDGAHISSERFRGRVRWLLAGGILLLVFITAVVLILANLGWLRPSITEEHIRESVVASLQRESDASFYVTGTLDLSTTTTVRNTKLLFPDILDFDLGTTEAIVRLPGRVHYGFDIRTLTAEHIQVQADGTVAVHIPPLSAYAVEPDLSRMEVQTSVGWARLYRSSGRRIEQRALQLANEALRQQAEQHLEDSIQPEINTARALEKLLVPALEAAGISDPKLQIQITPEIILQPEG